MTYMSPILWLSINQEPSTSIDFIKNLGFGVDGKAKRGKRAAVLNKLQDYLMKMQWYFLEPHCEQSGCATFVPFVF